ncbi:hypothetical protein DH2020_012455 [Rehmannia glutinosa]|uniref:R2R3-MYB protein n=1 Tax=Rehmannia glutinosa TaxID=99300 RepID=A0ABR0X0V3_REHGL
MGRAPCCDKANVKRGPWSPEEDAKLKSYIEKHGTGGNWIALPQKIGLKRCGKSCRLRWLNYLRPNIKHGGFTEDEDNLIIHLYITIGSRWSIIAAQLPGRTDNDIKNYWNTRLKKKLLGRQRREQQRGTHRRGGQNCNFSLNPRPPPQLVAPPPFLPPSNSAFTDIPITPPFDPKFSYDQPQILLPNNNWENLIMYDTSDRNISCSQNQHPFIKNSTVHDQHQLGSDINFRTFDEENIPEDQVMYPTPQSDGQDCLSAVDMINSSWGDIISCLFYPSAISSYGFCMPDENTTGLLGYSE